MQQQSTQATHTTGAQPPLTNTDQAIQQLQLILAKLDQQAQVQAALSNRLDQLEKATSPRGS
jgi:hypothetical protein